jgi:predicted transcriptional regulator
MDAQKEQMLIARMLSEIRSATEAMAHQDMPEELLLDTLPSAAELARLLDLRLEWVKKKLRILKHEGLIHAVTISPKRYRFDRYQFEHLVESVEGSDEHPLAFLFEPA